MYILGITAYHGDCSACLIKDGRIVAAVEEERFKRIKHWAGFPELSIQYCLEEAGVGLNDINYIAVARDPKANLKHKLQYVLKNRQGLRKLKDRFKNLRSVRGVAGVLSDGFKVNPEEVKRKVVNVEHHVAHMASSFLVSPYEDAAVMTIDGFGDFVSSMHGYGRDNKIRVLDRVFYPHSIGLFYTLITQFLGFTKYGDEYKVMGLASYGEPRKKDKLKDVIRYIGDAEYRLNLKYFRHHKDGVDMTWDEGEPTMGPLYSHKFVEAFGTPRGHQDELTDFHRDLAASLQAHTEDLIFGLLNDLYEQTKNTRLCLAGGVAMNSVANGKIFDNTPFEDVYIQSAAGDAGTSLGAAYYVWHEILGAPRDFVMASSYWGPEFSESEIVEVIRTHNRQLENGSCFIEQIGDEAELCRRTAGEISSGKVVGWFQGRMEWGPRALGNRSIVVDPRKREMVDVLNSRIKRRESFRPFAPSVLLEKTGEYFDKDYPDPFMLKVYPVKSEKRNIIPAVTHIDGSGRLQTVRREDNPLYWQLIKEFESITGVPVVLNTSFNENEPIVCTPAEAMNCFLRTKMDVLVLGNHVISRAVS
jgi:carbamoyltransferase